MTTANFGFRSTIHAHPGQGDLLVNSLLRAVSDDGPARNPACVFFLVSRSAAQPDVVHISEGWTSAAAHAANFASDASQAFIATLAPLTASAGATSDDVPVGGVFNL
jgi:quinol monooxygenase YgiN